jgi:hypothetical protein
VSVPVSVLCLFSCFLERTTESESVLRACVCVYVYTVIDILGETCAGTSAYLSMPLNSFIAATSARTSASSSSTAV